MGTVLAELDVRDCQLGYLAGTVPLGFIGDCPQS